MSLKKLVNDEIRDDLSNQAQHQLIKPVHPEVHFRYNSVNLLVGKRRSGKDFNVFREIAKLKYIEHDYTLLLYVTPNGENDLTYKTWRKHISLDVAVCAPSESADIIKELRETNSEYNKEHSDKARQGSEGRGGRHARHVIVLYSEAMNLFKNPASDEFRALVSNSQFNATYFLCVQNAKGLPTELKSNFDSIWIFGSFNKQAWNYLAYYMPLDISELYDVYVKLNKQDALLIEMNDNDDPDISVVQK